MVQEIKCVGVNCDNNNPTLGTVIVSDTNPYKGDSFYGFICESCAKKLQIQVEEINN